MYGQTGSGKTFTMIGPHEPPQANQYLNNHSAVHTEMGNLTPRTISDPMYTSKPYKTMNTQESDKSFENPLRGAGRVSFYRSKSPVPSRDNRDKTPRRVSGVSDKSPIRTMREKSPPRAETPISTIDFQQNKSSEGFNINFGNYSNVHKRSSTLPLVQGQSSHNMRASPPPREYGESRFCEMDTLKSHPENNEGILMLAMKDIFSEIERVKI